MVAATSIAAFRDLDVTQRQLEVLCVMYTQPDWTLYELAEVMGVPQHHLSGRITELKKMGKVVMRGYCRKNPNTGKSCNVVKAL